VVEKKKLKTFILKNKVGAFAKITNLGGSIMELHVPTKEGNLRDVVLGFDHPENYLNNPNYLGAIIGRCANRLGNSKFELDHQQYQLTSNKDPNHLHGGIEGFDKKLWAVTSVSKSHIVFHIRSPDGEEGYPGELDVRVKYMLDNNNQLLITYRATTDRPTIVNLSNHSYFNLNGAGQGDILNHNLQINADYIIPVDDEYIPLAQNMKVQYTPFDFRSSSKIGEHIDSDHEQIKIGSGYDHNYIINDYNGRLQKIAEVESSDSQLSMDVLTTEPGVQLYTSNSLDLIGKGGKKYSNRSAFCLETQHFPNSPNRSDFPSVVLRPGEVYMSQTVYAFN